MEEKSVCEFIFKKGKFGNDKLIKGVVIVGIGVIIKGFVCGGRKLVDKNEFVKKLVKKFEVGKEFEEDLDEKIFVKCKCGWFKGFSRKDDGISGDEMVGVFLDMIFIILVKKGKLVVGDCFLIEFGKRKFGCLVKVKFDDDV